MPRTKEQNEEIRRQRREAILRSALQVYAERGFAASEIGEIADRAGVARGLVYYYFKDKVTLFRELTVFMLEQSKSHISKVFSTEEPVPVQLENYVVGMYAGLLDNPEYSTFFMRLRHDMHEIFTGEEQPPLRGLRGENLKEIIDALERGMAAGEIRRMNPDLLMAQFRGAVMHGLIHWQQRALELGNEGKSRAEIAAIFRPDMRDAVNACLGMALTPVGERAARPDTKTENGVDEA